MSLPALMSASSTTNASGARPTYTHTHIHSHTHAAWPVPPRDTSHHITHLPRYRQARGLWATETWRLPTSMAEGAHPTPQASLRPRNSLATHGWCHETPSWIGSRPQLSPAGTLPDLCPARTWHGACCTHSQRRHVSHSQCLSGNTQHHAGSRGTLTVDAKEETARTAREAEQRRQQRPSRASRHRTQQGLHRRQHQRLDANAA